MIVASSLCDQELAVAFAMARGPSAGLRETGASFGSPNHRLCADGRALMATGGGNVQGLARKDLVFGAARVYTVPCQAQMEILGQRIIIPSHDLKKSLHRADRMGSWGRFNPHRVRAC